MQTQYKTCSSVFLRLFLAVEILDE